MRAVRAPSLPAILVAIPLIAFLNQAAEAAVVISSEWEEEARSLLDAFPSFGPIWLDVGEKVGHDSLSDLSAPSRHMPHGWIRTKSYYRPPFFAAFERLLRRTDVTRKSDLVG